MLPSISHAVKNFSGVPVVSIAVSNYCRDAEIVGTKIHLPEYQPTEEGLQAALKHARSLFCRSQYTSRSFQKTLGFVSAMLPEIDVTSGVCEDKWAGLRVEKGWKLRTLGSEFISTASSIM